MTGLSYVDLSLFRHFQQHLKAAAALSSPPPVHPSAHRFTIARACVCVCVRARVERSVTLLLSSFQGTRITCEKRRLRPRSFLSVGSARFALLLRDILPFLLALISTRILTFSFFPSRGFSRGVPLTQGVAGEDFASSPLHWLVRARLF